MEHTFDSEVANSPTTELEKWHEDLLTDPVLKQALSALAAEQVGAYSRYEVYRWAAMGLADHAIAGMFYKKSVPTVRLQLNAVYKNLGLSRDAGGKEGYTGRSALALLIYLETRGAEDLWHIQRSRYEEMEGKFEALVNLSALEMHVYLGLVSGIGYAQIAEAQSISPDDIHNHVSDLFHKLGLSSRFEATVLYVAYCRAHFPRT